jgi:hypothetical protein
MHSTINSIAKFKIGSQLNADNEKNLEYEEPDNPAHCWPCERVEGKGNGHQT